LETNLKEVEMKTLSITLNPKAWLAGFGLAVRNTFADAWHSLKNRRLWIGIAASLLVHAVIVILGVVEFGGKPVKSSTEPNIPVVVPPDVPVHPSVVSEVSQQWGNSKDEGTVLPRPLDPSRLSSGEVTITADDAYAWDSDPLIFNPRYVKSVDEILQEAPVGKVLGVGGERNPSRFDNPGIGLDRTDVIRPEDHAVTPVNPVTNPGSQTKTDVGAFSKSGFVLEGDLTPADIVSGPLPSYPEYARQKGLEGHVTITFRVNSRGEVASTMVVKHSIGDPQWDAAVKQTLARWRFKESVIPTRSGKVTFVFKLN
jgi:TonB family protein